MPRLVDVTEVQNPGSGFGEEILTRYRFRPKQRLKRPAEFRRVYDRRCSASDASLIVYVFENGLPFSRLGVSVGRKLGGAVQRNRLKRLLREAFRLSAAELPSGLDYVLIPRGASSASLDGFAASLRSLAPVAQKRLRRRA